MSKSTDPYKRQFQNTGTSRAERYLQRNLNHNPQDNESDNSDTSLNDNQDHDIEMATINELTTQMNALTERLNQALQTITTLQNQVDTQTELIDDQRRQIEGLAFQDAQDHDHTPSHSSGTKLRDYSGGYNPTFTEFIERFEMVAKASRWKQETWLDQLVLYLKDGALTAYKSIPAADKNDYNKVKTHLTQALEPVEKAKFYCSLLYNASTQRVQQPGEQVTTFASEIEKNSHERSSTTRKQYRRPRNSRS